MRLRITHETAYRFERPVKSVLQALRLTARDHDGQHVLTWRIEPLVDGRLRTQEDAFGNIVHMFASEGVLTDLCIRVTGEVETNDTAGLVAGAVEHAPDLVYLRETPLSRADEPIRTFARGLAGNSSRETLETLHRLLRAIHEEITFDTEPTHAGTTAAEAFALRRGVCQDLTHIFISAARSLRIPARYVSGYFFRADGVVEQDAGHAWAEAMVPGLGWVGFDPANGISVTEAHLRVAIGLDYLAAAPVRGSRYGGGSETLSVKLRVDDAGHQQ